MQEFNRKPFGYELSQKKALYLQSRPLQRLKSSNMNESLFRVDIRNLDGTAENHCLNSGSSLRKHRNNQISTVAKHIVFPRMIRFQISELHNRMSCYSQAHWIYPTVVMRYDQLANPNA